MVTRQMFQSTLPRGERHRRSEEIHLCDPFQSTLPRGGGATNVRTSVAPCSGFNPRSHGGERIIARGMLEASRSFNPRSHGGSDFLTFISIQQGTVSIHAPTGGATTARANKSQHGTRFNPRSHGGSDLCRILRLSSSARVSIHAPTGGATAAGNLRAAVREVSIHAPTGGATPRRRN